MTLNGLDPFYRWRIVVLYVLTHNNVSAENIDTLMRQTCDKAEDCGADVKLFVCDQGSPNRSAYNKLGITEANPFFQLGEKMLFAIHDFCHIIKNLVSAWQRYGSLIIEDEDVAFQDVITTWNADQANNQLSNTLGHISREHLYPNNFQR